MNTNPMNNPLDLATLAKLLEAINTSKTGASLPRMVRIAEVVNRTGLSRTTIWRKEKTGTFPLRKKLGVGSVGWLESELNDWIIHPR